MRDTDQLKNNLFKNGWDQKAGGGRRISRNIEEWIERARRGLIMVERRIDEIWLVGRLRKQNEDGVKLKKVEDGTEMSGEIVEDGSRECGMSKRMGKG
jgi:hypothetical protein